jgi:hypothetical protein
MNILGVNVKADPQGKSYDIYKRFIISLSSAKDKDKLRRRIRDIKKDQNITVN